jgi:hypothetical protein
LQEVENHDLRKVAQDMETWITELVVIIAMKK